MRLVKEWNDIPNVGLILIRMFHERKDKHVFHIHLKINDKPWFDQPKLPVPVFSAEVSSCEEFWDWAKENLPVWDYPDIVKPHN